MEKKLKDLFKSRRKLVPSRGGERVRMKITDLFNIFEVVQGKDVHELKDTKTKNPHKTRSKDRFKSPKVGDKIKVKFEIKGKNRWYSGKVINKTRGVTSIQFIDGVQEFKGARALTKKAFDRDIWKY